MQNNSAYIAWLIKKQWIRNEFVATDLITLDVIDQDFIGGYRPTIIEMSKLRDILWEDLSITDLIDTPSILGTSGQILQMDILGEGLEWIDMIDTFLELTDTPNDYTGYAGFLVTVNQTEDELEFTPPIVLTPHYEARVFFNNALNPAVEQLLENTLGVSVTWTNTGTGIYQANFSAPVDDTKLTAYIGSSSPYGVFTIGSFFPSFIQFIHYNFLGTPSNTSSVIPIEIKLYA
tara:strand:- start:860 stop:1558 length:699 start_codon:yes stop_codon:yes gene_type:complete